MTLLDLIKAWCLANYEKGGSWIIETFDDAEIVAEFKTLKASQSYCRLMQERENECKGW